MNPFKSPHQLLLEEAGASLDPSPGLVNTPQQMLMQQANVLPHFAPGGHVQNLSPADMQAALIVNGQTPQNFATGGQSIAGLYSQIPAKKAAYEKEQSEKAQNAANYYNQPQDPYFQNIINKASAHNFDELTQDQNQEPVWQAQPDANTYSTKARDAFAKGISKLTGNERWSEETTNDLFGTGYQEPWTMQNAVPKAIKTAVQFVNPVSTTTGIMDAPHEASDLVREGNYLGAGLLTGLTAATALPYFKPAKNLVKKLKK